jgi:DNA mismatch endonuclease (patch repair protein)
MPPATYVTKRIREAKRGQYDMHGMAFPNVPSEVRKRMASIRARGTKPELVVRRLAHAWGFRFRLHRRDLPGRPDMVFPRHQKVIFVHGCFWHQHACALGKKKPRTRPEYWLPKLCRNVARDARNVRRLRAAGWRVMVIWECETRVPATVERRLWAFLK